MTMRLRCRTCGWSVTYRRRDTSVAALHDCGGAPDVYAIPSLWARLVGAQPKHIPTTTAGRVVPAGLTAALGAQVWPSMVGGDADCARRGMVDVVRAGYQVGPPPYGYSALRIRVTTAVGHSKYRVVLVPDWHTAVVVKQIFTWRVEDHLGCGEIAQRLNADHRQYPPPTSGGNWTDGTVRRLIQNPKYTGRQVWARTTKGRQVPVTQWITSAPMAHEPLVDDRTFHHAQPHRDSGGDHAA